MRSKAFQWCFVVAFARGMSLMAGNSAHPDEAVGSEARKARLLTVEHAPEAPIVVTREVWTKLPRASVKVPGPNGEETTYEGVAMAEMLKLVKAPLGKELRGNMLAKFVLVTAADDYRVVFALPEIDPESTTEVVLLADRRDGEPLDAKEGPYRIVAPSEKKHGRWVRQVTRIAILAADERGRPANE